MPYVNSHVQSAKANLAQLNCILSRVPDAYIYKRIHTYTCKIYSNSNTRASPAVSETVRFLSSRAPHTYVKGIHNFLVCVLKKSNLEKITINNIRCMYLVYNLYIYFIYAFARFTYR